MSTNDSKLHYRCIFCKIANLQDPETRILYQVTNYKFELHDYILTIKTQSSGTCSDSSISYFKRCKQCTFCYLVTLFTQCTYFFIIMYQLPFGAQSYTGLKVKFPWGNAIVIKLDENNVLLKVTSDYCNQHCSREFQGE